MKGLLSFQLIISMILCCRGGPDWSLNLAGPLSDSSYVYKTGYDFVNDVPSVASPFEIKTGNFGLYSRLWTVTTSQNLKLWVSKTSSMLFKPGVVFAFINKGQTYVYIPSFYRYMTLVYRDPKICIYLDNTASGLVLRFAKGLLDRPKRLDEKKNVTDCFKDDPEYSNRLLEIREKVVLDPWFKNQEQVFHETQPVIQSILQGGR
jgi:hypothetical protein